MAVQTADPHRTSMSAEAFELISCFYNGVDVLVRELAEQIARKEGMTLEAHPDTLAIEKHHVEQAGSLVFNRLQSLFDEASCPQNSTSMSKGWPTALIVSDGIAALHPSLSETR